MARPSPFIRQSGSLEIKMTPMIDVVFLLLVFFVWSASFQVAEQLLPSQIRSASGTAAPRPDDPPPPEDDFDRIVVRVRSQTGRLSWTVNAQPARDLADLRTRLVTIAEIKRDVPVILHPDPDVALGHVIDVYDITRLIGFEQIQFAASQEL